MSPKEKSQYEICEAELKRAKEDLEDLEIYIERYTSFLPIAVFAVSGVGIIVEINKTAEILGGYKSLEMVGMSLEEVFYPTEELKKIMELVQQVEEIKGRELTLISKDKKEIPVSVAVSARKEPNGEIVGYFVAATEITELKKLQEGLKEAGMVLEIKVQARTRELKELAESLEKKVEERTRELQDRVNELERFKRLTVGRELKMLELKKEIKDFKKPLNQTTNNIKESHDK